MDRIGQFLYTWIFLPVLTSQMLSSLTKAAVLYGTWVLHLFLQRKRDKSGNRETDREKALVVFGWMWRVGDLRSLQNLNYLLALLQPASISR